MNDQEPLLAGYEEMAACLTERAGLKISKSTLQKLGAPSIREALPVEERLPIEGYWMKLPVVKPDRLLDWALRRLRPSRNEPPPPSIAAQPAPPAPVPPAPKVAAAPPPHKRGRPRNDLPVIQQATARQRGRDE
jgi:hypothetical protein